MHACHEVIFIGTEVGVVADCVVDCGRVVVVGAVLCRSRSNICIRVGITPTTICIRVGITTVLVHHPREQVAVARIVRVLIAGHWLGVG